jgi:serine/threonine-protein kinase RsbW/stage II sporulation protein AB (anti-sigma F factor)
MWDGVVEESSRTEVEIAPMLDQRVVLTIPPRAEYITLGRLALAALGGQGRLPEETTADLKVAVSEACSYLLRFLAVAQPAPEAGIRIEYLLSPARWVIEVSSDGLVIPPLDQDADPRSEASLGLTIIRALVDELELTSGDSDRSILRLVKRV